MARGRLAGLLALYRFAKSRESGLPLKLLLLTAVVYVVLPADFIPDVLPFVGWVDDLGIVTLVLGLLTSGYARYKKRAQESAAARTTDDPWAPPPDDRDVSAPRSR